MLRASSLTTAAITGGNTPYTLAQWGIPFVGGPTGTMANNGAVTWGTALPNAYLGGAWVSMPAGSIAAGVPAASAWLWYVGTNTTTGTFFNSTYTSGVPTMGTQTAFATTGPGAFTGITAETTGPVITIAAGLLLANGKALWDFNGTSTNSAGAKTYKVKTPGTTIYSIGPTTQSNYGAIGYVQNRGIQTAQVAESIQSIAADSIGISYPAENTANSWTLSWTMTRATATDVAVLERGGVVIAQGA